MDYSTPSKVGASTRRKAAASRRAAREGLDGEDQQQQDNHNLLSSLSMALSSNIGNHNTTANHNNNNNNNSNNNNRNSNNDYFSSKLFSDMNAITSTMLPSSSTTNTTAITINNNNSSTSSSSTTKTFTPRSRKYNYPPPPSQFASYLHFHKSSLASLLGFTICYALVLICCWPMISTLNADNTTGNTNMDEITMNQHGASFQHIRGRKTFLHAKHAVAERLGTFQHRAEVWEERAKLAVEQEVETMEKKVLPLELGNTIGRKDAMRASLILEEAVREFEGEIGDGGGGVGRVGSAAALDAWEKANAIVENNDGPGGIMINNNNNNNNNNNDSKQKQGFMVLGMHRSGTSMLSGLLVKGFGYETGGPLIGAAFDNEKGFYERIDVVLQNDEFFAAQRIGWSFNVFNYDTEKALFDKVRGTIKFREGDRALVFLNGKHVVPYIQKDPRMCIALPTWLKLLNQNPAIVFTYRHPLEVAMSLKKREEGFTLEHGLRLWIVYNMRAIQNSVGLCRVFSTNDAVVKDPLKEVQRIADELTTKCHVLPPPVTTISRQVVDEFVDPSLQHNKKQREAKEESLAVLADGDFGNGCAAREIESDYPEGSSNRKAEVDMYLMAMSVFCDLESGKAYDEDYEWPDLVTMKRPARIG